MVEPVDADEFEGLVQPLGPFEAQPTIAVAVSGGRDSMALAFLCSRWVRSQGGRAVLLTVDHGLRPEAADECAFVEAWAQENGVECHILTWSGPKPISGVQEAARRARYALVEGWCRANGVLHLFLAHHQDDQEETLLMRLSKGSEPLGLAAMAPVVEMRHLRLLRPLLGIARDRLEATVKQEGIGWVDDPSNDDAKYERTRMRRLNRTLKGEGLGSHVLTEMAESFRSFRGQTDVFAAQFLGVHCSLHSAGFARMSKAALAQLDEEGAILTLGRLVRTVGGLAYTPQRHKLTKLQTRLAEAPKSAATLGNCRFAERGGFLFVFRESRNLPAPLPLTPDETRLYDSRFQVRAPMACRVAPLGVEGWRDIKSRCPELLTDIAPSIRGSLPAFWDGAGLLAVPPLRYWRDGMGQKLVKRFQMDFRPPHPLCGIGLRLT